ncbi:hypothetical protein [Ornithinibacillus scapharcae]|uniref:hypothetical protein n=1 Tax=Ornithinibacillus scapharcae TaxID=1147159 RepID=UPI000225B0AE|nr:hypothetical protein [Ornithinibacillus scapharcae]
MKRIRLENWLLDVDWNKTAQLYNKDIDLCHCLYCRNFKEVTKNFSPTMESIFTILGINPSKPMLLSEFGKTEKGLHLYIASYPFVGQLIEGSYCTDSEWNETNTTTVGFFTFGITKELVVKEDELPRPSLQVDVEARIPWILDESSEG